VAAASSPDAKRWREGFADAQAGRYVANAEANVPRVSVRRRGRQNGGGWSPIRTSWEGL